MDTIKNSKKSNKSPEVYKYLPPNPKEEKDIMLLWGDTYDMPLASILCLTYQHKNFIKHTLNGFLMQETSFPFEIIIRDDASSDGTREIVEKYAKKYPKIIKVLLEEENLFSKGVQPLGRILPMASGKYIALCEGDDFWADESKLQKQVSFLEENDDYVITYSDAIVVDEHCNIVRTSLLGKGKKDYTRDELIMSASVPTLTRCFRNLIKTMPKEHDYIKNGDTFLISLLGKFGSAKYLDDIKKSVYRQHSGGIWAGINESNKGCMLGTTFFWMSIYYKRIGLNDVSDKYAQNSLLKFSKILKVNKKTAIKIFLHTFAPEVYIKIKSILNNIFRR